MKESMIVGKIFVFFFFTSSQADKIDKKRVFLIEKRTFSRLQNAFFAVFSGNHIFNALKYTHLNA
jgi:hypothetical protein